MSQDLSENFGCQSTTGDRGPREPWRPRRLRRLLAGIVIVGLVPVFWLFVQPRLSGNLGVVDGGRVIRSAQPRGWLPALIQEHRLASILNLRGGAPSDWWYVAEVRAARDHGVAFFDLPLSAQRRPTRRELLILIDTLQRCPYPLLIHCKAGADRTGLATAVYLMTQRGEPPEMAKRAFSIWYGHLPLLGAQRLHEPVDEYAAWLRAEGQTHSPSRFRDWVKFRYRSTDPCVDPPRLAAGPRHSL
jgi:protein tyrosine phosphatase (PTP) superfamily phosphohydrolase (DUF442 family)